MLHRADRFAEIKAEYEKAGYLTTTVVPHLRAQALYLRNAVIPN